MGINGGRHIVGSFFLRSRILVVFQESPGIGRIWDGQIVLVWRVTRTKGRLSNSSDLYFQIGNRTSDLISALNLQIGNRIRGGLVNADARDSCYKEAE